MLWWRREVGESQEATRRLAGAWFVENPRATSLWRSFQGSLALPFARSPRHPLYRKPVDLAPLSQTMSVRKPVHLCIAIGDTQDAHGD